jgi:DNA-binding NarL/FixJ family response regulator
MLAEIILDLHREMLLVSDLKDFPEHISKPVIKAISFDKLCIFFSGAHDSSPTLICEGTAPICWENIYPNITAEDMHNSILYRGEPGDIFLKQDMKGPGCKGDEHVLGLISQFAGLNFSIHLVLSVMKGFRLHLSLFRSLRPFNRDDAETLRQLSPALTMKAKALISSRISESGDLLLAVSEEKSSFHYLLLDNNLKVIGLPELTREFLAEHFHDPFIKGLPATLRKWLDDCGLAGSKCNQAMTCQRSFLVETGPVECKVIPLEDSSGKTIFLTSLNPARRLDDFSPLSALGLSAREIQVLDCLYSGKSNAQTGEHLGIRDVTVCKHLRSIGNKLHAFNRTEILSKAIENLNDIPSRQPRSEVSEHMTALTHDNHIKAASLADNEWPGYVFSLSRGLADLRDFDEAPDLFKRILGESLDIDWVTMYWVSASNDIERIFSSSGLQFDWEKLYPAIRKNISWLPQLKEMELGGIFLTQDLPEPQNENDIIAKAIVEAATGAHYALTMPVARTREHRVYIQFFRNDPNRPYTEKDSTLIRKLSPLIISWAQSFVDLKQSSINQLGSRGLLEEMHIRAVLLDGNLCDIMWTEDALNMMNSQVGPSWRHLLFPSVRDWLRQTEMFRNLNKNKSCIYPEHLIMESYNLSCCAYPLEGYIIVNFRQHAPNPFIGMKKYGLTAKEIQVIDYLTLGYTNRQIASVVQISEVAVKKRIEKIGQKLSVSGRTSIVREAEIFKQSRNPGLS